LNSLNAAPLKKTFFSFSDHLASWVSVCWFLRLPKVDLCCKALLRLIRRTFRSHKLLLREALISWERPWSLRTMNSRIFFPAGKGLSSFNDEAVTSGVGSPIMRSLIGWSMVARALVSQLGFSQSDVPSLGQP
jgi:hypothetical protein